MDIIKKTSRLKAGCFINYFIASTIALKASGWFIAKSASAFLFSSIPFLCIRPINSEYDIPYWRTAALILWIQSPLKFLFFTRLSRYAYTWPFSYAFLATVQTFFRLPNWPLTFLKTFFFLCFAATTFTERGIIFRFFLL